MAFTMPGPWVRSRLLRCGCRHVGGVRASLHCLCGAWALSLGSRVCSCKVGPSCCCKSEAEALHPRLLRRYGLCRRVPTLGCETQSTSVSCFCCLAWPHGSPPGSCLSTRLWPGSRSRSSSSRGRSRGIGGCMAVNSSGTVFGSLVGLRVRPRCPHEGWPPNNGMKPTAGMGARALDTDRPVSPAAAYAER